VVSGRNPLASSVPKKAEAETEGLLWVGERGVGAN